VYPFDPQHVSRKAGHLLRMEQERILVVLPEFGIQLAQIEGEIQSVGVGVGIAEMEARERFRQS